jgi:RHS repeat-associated protein
MWMPNMPVNNNNALSIWNTTGHKQYELSNHLGNVVTTVSDVINADAAGNPLPDILSAQDYYAFGSQQPNRSYARSSAYRYGFNGKENDNEVKGTGNEQDYGMRIYDPRVGRFLSVDPLTNKYPWWTPYQFAGNMPIKHIDIDGGEVEGDENEAEDFSEREQEERVERQRNELSKLKSQEELNKEREMNRKSEESRILRRPNQERVPNRSTILGRIKGITPDVLENTANALGNQTQDFKQMIEDGAKENLAANRYLPGTAIGTGLKVNGQWLKGSQGNAGFVPNSIAAKLNGRGFNNFDEFRSAFWKEVANDKDLASQFSKQNVARMQKGLAPFASDTQASGGQTTYILHHITPIYTGGSVYDLDNIMIVTPLFHNSTLTPEYHYNFKETNNGKTKTN